MTSVAEIEEAVSRLPPADFAAFRAWLDAFEAERFDRRIDEDAAAGRLDRLAEEALVDLRRVRVSAVFDLVDEGSATHIARDKDRMVAEAVSDEHRRETGLAARPRRAAKPRGG